MLEEDKKQSKKCAYKSINEFTKEDLRLYIDDFEKQGYGEYECLCAYCVKYDNEDNKPEDCYPDENNEDCFDAYKELIMEARYEANTT